MGHGDEIRDRLEELLKLHKNGELPDEGFDEVFHLAFHVLTERDVVRGQMIQFLYDLVEQRTRAVMGERQL